MNIKLLFIGIALTASFGCTAQTTISANDPNIRYSGRIFMKEDAAVLSWSASSITINFNGTSVSAIIRDQRGDNYYNVIVDGNVVKKLHPDNTRQTYKLVDSLTPGKHTLQLFKRTEWAMGKTFFHGFVIPEGTTVLPPPLQQKRKIEFFGNSISCGYAVEDTAGKDRGTSPYENGYISYAAITARHFDAELYNTSRSGIGITVSWFPLTMPEMYDRLEATNPDTKWDFSKYTPQVVVINLFQNDSWIVTKPDNEQFKARFGTTPPTAEFIINAYQNFVKNIRSKYPDAKIICILGSMDATKAGSPWPGYIDAAVAPLKDKNIYTHFIPYKNTPGHPNVKEQQDMANDLIAFMEKNISW